MSLDREAIYSAMFARLQTMVTSAVFFTRHYEAWANVQQGQQPALLFVATHQTNEEQRRYPTIWNLGADVVIYVSNLGDPSVSPDTQINQAIRQVETALERQSGEAGANDNFKTTLGGLCQTCRINGTIEITQGEAGGQGTVIIPIEMVAVA